MIKRIRKLLDDFLEDWEVFTLGAVSLAVLVIYLLHLLSPHHELPLEGLLSLTTLLILVLLFSNVTVIALHRNRKRMEGVAGQITALIKTPAELYETKDATFAALTEMTRRSKDTLRATRFSPGDITREAAYWDAVVEKAQSPNVVSTRIHSLAHYTPKALEGLCTLVDDLVGAQQFTLGVTFCTSEFEIIVADERECILCFHYGQTTIRNGMRMASENVTRYFADTFEEMLRRCYVQISFDTFVRDAAASEKLKSFLRKIHTDFVAGVRLDPISHDEMQRFLSQKVFA